MTDRDTFTGLDTYRDHAPTRWQRGRTALGWLYLTVAPPLVLAVILGHLIGGAR